MATVAVGDKVQYVGGGRFSGNQVFTGLWELRMGDAGFIHAVPGEKGDIGCTFGSLKVSLNKDDVRQLKLTEASLKRSHRSAASLSASSTAVSAKPCSSSRMRSTSFLQQRPRSQLVDIEARKISSCSQASPRPMATKSLGKTSSSSRFQRAGMTCLTVRRLSGASTECHQSGEQSTGLPALAAASREPDMILETQPGSPVLDAHVFREPAYAGNVEPQDELDDVEVIADSERPHPPSFYCPISHQCMHDPVILTDGHTYERRHIETWLQSNDSSPVTGTKLSQKVTFPNHALRNAIEEYFEQILGDHRLAIKRAICGLQRQDFSASNTTLLNTIDSLMQCSILVNADLSIEHVLTKIMQEAKSLIGADVASVFLVDRKRNELFSTVNSTGGELRIPMKSGVAGAVAYSGIPVIIRNAYTDTRFNKEVDTKTGFKTKSILCVPIKAWKGAIIGVAQLINKTTGGLIIDSCDGEKNDDTASDDLTFTADDQQFFEVLAAQAGAAIVNSGIFESMPGVSGAGRWPSPDSRRTPSHTKLPSLTDLRCLSRAASKESLVAAAQGSLTQMERPLSAKSSATKEESALSPKRLSMVKPLLFSAAESWEMDTLALAELTGDRPLSTLATYLFEHFELVSFFQIDSQKLQKFVLLIERGYPISNHYHNRAHAASVLHFMSCLLRLGGLAKMAHSAADGIDGVERQAKFILLAGLLAAMVHDYEHEGVNNDFLVKTNSDRAILYNDKSPNENHHVAAAWFVLQKPECNFLENLTVKEYRQVRKLVVDMVLATDMAEHTNILKRVQDLQITELSSSDALMVLQLALKCADLGHLSLCWSSHMRWVQRLEEEFFTQGDNEAKLGMPEISFLMDRNKQGASDTQVGFFDFVVLPQFRSLIAVCPSAQPMMFAVEQNYQRWKDIQVEQAAIVA